MPSLPFWPSIQEPMSFKQLYPCKRKSYLRPGKQLEQIHVLREACSWEIIWRIWNQSIPLDKQSQTKIDLTRRNILFGPQCIFKSLSQHKNCEISNIEGGNSVLSVPTWQHLLELRNGSCSLYLGQRLSRWSQSIHICICYAYKDSKIRVASRELNARIASLLPFSCQYSFYWFSLWWLSSAPSMWSECRLTPLESGALFFHYISTTKSSTLLHRYLIIYKHFS